MILVHQRYFAKPGLHDQVLETRIEASRRLRELGVPTGRIWVALRDEPGSPPASTQTSSGSAATGRASATGSWNGGRLEKER